MWLKVLTTLLLVQYLRATCDVCQSGNAACHSEDTYSVCINGEPMWKIIPCPVGYICTGEKFICYPEADGLKPICKSGDIAPTPTSTPEDTTLEDTTAEDTTPEDTTPEDTTPEDKTSEDTTPEDTTPKDTTPGVTTPAVTTPGGTTPVDTDYRTFCGKNVDGSYTNESDPTCKSYIECWNGSGTVEYCQKTNQKETYFNGKKCDILKPEFCT